MTGERSYQFLSSFFENEAAQLKELTKSKTNIEIDFETGNFKGQFNDISFSGNFLIEHTAAGFVKGFVYTVSLGYLSKPITDDKASQQFFDRLIKTNRIYFNPEKILEPDYINIELVQTEDNTELNFTKIMKTGE